MVSYYQYFLNMLHETYGLKRQESIAFMKECIAKIKGKIPPDLVNDFLNKEYVITKSPKLNEIERLPPEMIVQILENIDDYHDFKNMCRSSKTIEEACKLAPRFRRRDRWEDYKLLAEILNISDSNIEEYIDRFDLGNWEVQSVYSTESAYDRDQDIQAEYSEKYLLNMPDISYKLLYFIRFGHLYHGWTGHHANDNKLMNIAEDISYTIEDKHISTEDIASWILYNAGRYNGKLPVANQLLNKKIKGTILNSMRRDIHLYSIDDNSLLIHIYPSNVYYLFFKSLDIYIQVNSMDEAIDEWKYYMKQVEVWKVQDE